MTRIALLVALALTVAGCNNKIKKYADKIDAMSVYHAMEAGGPSVSLGRWALPEGAQGETAESVANALLAAFEFEMAQRLAQVLRPVSLSEIAAGSATQAMNNNGPYPVDPQSRWQLHLDLVDYGVSGGVGSEATVYVNLDAQVYGPKGKRIWRRGVYCSQPLAPNLGAPGSVAQTAANVAVISGMTDRELRQAFDDVATWCGREAVDRLRGTVSRAK